MIPKEYVYEYAPTGEIIKVGEIKYDSDGCVYISYYK